MNKLMLISLVILSGMAQIGCEKKISDREAMNACLFDPSGNCQRKVATMAQAPGMAPIANNIVAQNPALRGSAPVLGGTVSISSADLDAVKAHAKKVEAGIQADNNNPNSLHYDPPQEQRTPSSAVTPATASSSAGGSVSDAGIFSDSGAGSAAAAR